MKHIKAIFSLWSINRKILKKKKEFDALKNEISKAQKDCFSIRENLLEMRVREFFRILGAYKIQIEFDEDQVTAEFE